MNLVSYNFKYLIKSTSILILVQLVDGIFSTLKKLNIWHLTGKKMLIWHILLKRFSLFRVTAKQNKLENVALLIYWGCVAWKMYTNRGFWQNLHAYLNIEVEKIVALFSWKKNVEKIGQIFYPYLKPPLSTSKAEYIHTIGYKSKIFRSQVKSFSKCNVWG